MLTFHARVQIEGEKAVDTGTFAVVTVRLRHRSSAEVVIRTRVSQFAQRFERWIVR